MTFLKAVAEGRVNCPRLPNIAYETANYFMMFFREIFWEDIRRREFPHCPSRQRCLWLVHTIEQANYWVKRMQCNTDYQIVKVSARGRIHTANELFLMGDSATLPEITERARLYWLGLMPEGAKEEIIFEGFLQVTDVITPNCDKPLAANPSSGATPQSP